MSDSFTNLAILLSVIVGLLTITHFAVGTVSKEKTLVRAVFRWCCLFSAVFMISLMWMVLNDFPSDEEEGLLDIIFSTLGAISIIGGIGTWIGCLVMLAFVNSDGE